MTVYEFLQKFDEPFSIIVDSINITNNEPVRFKEIKLDYEERQDVLNALERTVLTVDFVSSIIYC